MALNKNIELDNGIVVSYHRIVTINKITNKSTIIEVASYVNEAQRRKEEAYYQNPTKDMNVFIYTEYIEKEYNENETIEDLYEYLKTTERFKDAEDV